MINSITALVFKATGTPEEVIELVHRELPDIKPNQVLVKMQAAPINPADLNVLEGLYPVKPELPAIAGNEGVGMIIQKGLAVKELKVGQQVIAPHRMGTWCEAFIAEEEELYMVPPGVPKHEAAMLSVNPPTAWRMLHDFVELKTGEWVIQNAANSSVGHAVIQIAKSRFLQTVNIVRDPKWIEPLKKLGADVVVVHGDHMVEEIREAVGDAPIRLGLNATSGPILRDTVKCLGHGGTLVTYGAMSREPFSVSNAHFIFRDLTARGFWITQWYQEATTGQIKDMFASICALIKRGSLTSPVEITYPLIHARKALLHAKEEGRSGKVLFTIS